MTTRGFRNKNLFNIRCNYSNNWIGLVGKDKESFCVFDNFDHGVRAGLKILSTYCNKYHIKNTYGIVKRFAPPSENNTFSYYGSLRDRGVPSCMCSFEDWIKLAKEMIYIESLFVIEESYLVSICVKYNIKFN